MELYAHIRADTAVQTVSDHCRQTARYAAGCLAGVGLEQTGYLAGLLHDFGKMKQEFCDYLRSGTGVRGSVNHTFAGCRFLLERFHGETAGACEDLSAELLACAVGGHHGLFDCVDEDGKSGFLHRMQKPEIGYEECLRNFMEQCADEKELSERFGKANGELTAVYQRLAELTQEYDEITFHYGLLARLLLSAVIEGDRRDTAEFMCGIQYPSDSVDWGRYLAYMEEKLAAFPQQTPIQRARGEISQQCRWFAERGGGAYRLNVPTGGGKTLSSLRYALAHAEKWGKQRIIFTSPLLSILEQNAAVIRQFLGDDSIVLEHHSNVIQTEQSGELDMRELATESWNAPVIITTLVQLLQTLFDGKTTAIRRFQSLCGSIIVIDEVQTVPTKMLTLFNLAVDFLVEVCGATVLLCSATQPCLEKTEHPMRRCREDVVPYDEALWAVFCRNVIQDAGAMTLVQTGDFARAAVAEAGSLLLVCNKKSEAEQLFRSLDGAAEVCRHLSASMCIAHRRQTLRELEDALAQGKTCLCVATQVIEAGVDISFGRVIRLAAGLDSIIQAAGRCNRHGESPEPVPVYVLRCMDERLGRLREIEEGKKATISLLEAFRRNPEDFCNDLASDQAVGYYYQKLYRAMPKEAQDYTVKSRGGSVFRMLSANTRCYDMSAPYAGKFMLSQAFRRAGQVFQVFDNDAQDVVVPFGDGARLIQELESKAQLSPVFLWDWVRRARAYTVSVYDYQINALGGDVKDFGGVLVLSESHYDDKTGLCIRPGEYDFLEV